MSQYTRRRISGGIYFFTLVAFQRRRLFHNETAVQLFREVVREIQALRPFVITAAVILPDHLHMMWELAAGDADYSDRWSRIKSTFTRRYPGDVSTDPSVSTSQRRERRRGIWQRRFYEHTIRDEDDLIRHVEYIHYNPVKHGLASCPKDWPWSSFHRYVERGIYPEDWCCGNEPPAHVEMEGYE